MGFPELPDAGEITSLVFLQYKKIEQVFPSKVPPGSLESVQILASALGARIPLFWEFGSSLNYALHRYILALWPRSPDSGCFFQGHCDVAKVLIITCFRSPSEFGHHKFE